MYVPVVAGYENEFGTRTLFPQIYLYDRDAGANYEYSTTTTKWIVSGDWNFITDTLTIQSDANLIALRIYSNQSATATTNATYVIVDDVVITDISCPTDRFISTTIPDSPNLSMQSIGLNMIQKAAAAPTDVHQTYAVGDIIWKITPTTGAAPGWVCTTGGAGGTAVFTEMANLD